MYKDVNVTRCGQTNSFYQWYYNNPSKDIISKIPLHLITKAYYCLHDLDLELAIKKVGEV